MSFLKRLVTYKHLFNSYGLSPFNSSKRFGAIYFVNKDKNSSDTISSGTLKYFFLVASGFLTYKLLKQKSLISSASAATILTSGLSGRRKQYNFVADVVETCAPAVVYIEIKDTRRFDFFTGRPITISNGSGFIIKEDGLILTNAHVVANKPYSKVEVRLHNGVIYNGHVENVDVQSDLATVRISANKLPTLKLGKSSDLQPGEFVVAIGSPLALSNSVTFGVISATSRGSDELGLKGKDMVYLQTDAAITFGNSGGPLVNLDGEAIGINSMKVTAGISFAIPSDYVKQFLQSADVAKKAGKTLSRKYMGITMLTLTPQILHELQQKNEYVPPDIKSGVLVWKVILGSPAHSGGLQPGDIVTHIDGKVIRGANDVYAILAESTTRTITMSINRRGNKMEVYVTPENID